MGSSVKNWIFIFDSMKYTKKMNEYHRTEWFTLQNMWKLYWTRESFLFFFWRSKLPFFRLFSTFSFKFRGTFPPAREPRERTRIRWRREEEEEEEKLSRVSRNDLYLSSSTDTKHSSNPITSRPVASRAQSPNRTARQRQHQTKRNNVEEVLRQCPFKKKEDTK